MSNSIIITVLLSIIIIILALIAVTKYIINPLKSISNEVKKFEPSGDTLNANVINLNINRNDEIGEIYDNIRANQIKIVDYIKNITEM